MRQRTEQKEDEQESTAKSEIDGNSEEGTVDLFKHNFSENTATRKENEL